MSVRICVLGFGHFGLSLSTHLCRKGFDVFLWTRSKEKADLCQSQQKITLGNQSYDLPSNLTVLSQVSALFAEKPDLLLITVPTQELAKTCELIAPYYLKAPYPIVCAVKGIDIETLELPLSTLSSKLKNFKPENFSVLSGPSFASEIMQNLPTAVVVAGRDHKNLNYIQSVFHSPFFRVYTSPDPIGVEVAGAIKNVIAIACGACRGQGFMNNSQAALMTRGLAEIMRFGTKMGAHPITFNGLSGVGDLFLTCTSSQSRNFQVGFQLAQGESLENILKNLGSVAEGVTTAKAAFALSQKLGVTAPITDEVYAVLYNKKPIKEAIQSLLTRDAKPEF